MGETYGNKLAKDLGESLNQAIQRLLENRKSPSRRVNELDNRASNFYIALYWAEFMALRNPVYKEFAEELKTHRHDIVNELKGTSASHLPPFIINLSSYTILIHFFLSKIS